MNDEITQKQVWQTPEIFDLDVELTGGGLSIYKEVGAYRPAS